MAIRFALAFTFAAVTLTAQPSVPRRLDQALESLQRFRYTAQPQLLEDARRNLAEAAKLDPGHFFLRKLQAWSELLGGNHEKALQLAGILNRQVPDDVEIYGYLAECHIALGDIQEAERQVQWMLRLRPQHHESMRLTAILRERLGDADGAIFTLNDLYQVTSASEPLRRAWILARIARLTAKTNPERAAKLARKALETAPEAAEAIAIASKLLAKE
ncbi:MAG: tetratricopeptide repeat protein [Bryobacteraceae bacterium]|nr:tetratricopeptide repeat protein [Bryobacteraceae bacterium]